MLDTKSLLIVPAFGLDTFVVAATLGVVDGPARWRLAGTLALFEGGMPLLGAVLGAWLARILSGAVVYGAAALLAIMAGRELWEGLREAQEGEDDEDPAEMRRLRQVSSLLALPAAGLAVSLDELTAGLAAGSSRLSLPLLVPALALQAVLFTGLGLRAGARVRRMAGRYGEVAGGAALLLVAVGVVLLPHAGR